jgi:hypothetical protein
LKYLDVASSLQAAAATRHPTTAAAAAAIAAAMDLAGCLLLTVHVCLHAVASQHAELLQKNKQVFLRALQGESVFDR